MDLASMRRDYTLKSLNESEVLPDAMQQFNLWFGEAIEAAIPEPNAMTLATCTLDAKPSARIMLLKGATPEGFIFFTNYDSRKAVELEQNPNASLVFLWLELQREVRIEGKVERISKEESEAYFYLRPFESQVSALISPQSRIIDGKGELEQLQKTSIKLYEGAKVPFPQNWGGYILIPSLLEFWQGRASRFHDRIQYSKNGDGWARARLAP